MPVPTEVLGFAGTLIIIAAYVPQMKHIVEEHCAGGVSRRSWYMWLVASLFLLVHAFNIGDLVFMSLQVANVGAVLVTLFLIRKYGKRVCHTKESKLGVSHDEAVE